MNNERLKKNELDEMDLEEDKKSFIKSEIAKFRDTYRRAEVERDKDSKGHRQRRREYESPDPRPSRDRSEMGREQRTTSREEFDQEDNQRKLQLRDAIYQDHLRFWLGREETKAKEYAKKKHEADEQKKDEAKEARRLKEFLEDYEDEIQDRHYFVGEALVSRMKKREMEIEEDIIDRQNEKNELDELRKKLIQEGHPDPQGEVEKLLLEESHLMEPPRPDSPESEPEYHPSPDKIKSMPRPASPIPIIEEKERIPSRRIVASEKLPQNYYSRFADVSQPQEAWLMGFTSLRLGGSPTQQHNSSPIPATNNHVAQKKKFIDDFNQNDEGMEREKKRKLNP